MVTARQMDATPRHIQIQGLLEAGELDCQAHGQVIRPTVTSTT